MLLVFSFFSCLFFWPHEQTELRHVLHAGKSGSVAHLAGVVVQRVIVDGAILPVFDLEKAWTLGGASVLGCSGGRSLVLWRWQLRGRGNTTQLTDRHQRAKAEAAPEIKEGMKQRGGIESVWEINPQPPHDHPFLYKRFFWPSVARVFVLFCILSCLGLMQYCKVIVGLIDFEEIWINIEYYILIGIL